MVTIQDFGYYKKTYEYLKKKYLDKKIDYYLIDELINNKKINRAEIAKRKNFYVMIAKKNYQKIYTGKQSLNILEKEKFSKKKIDNVEELTGFTAYKKRVQGKVVIIKRLTDFKKDYKDKIIVSPMTIP